MILFMDSTIIREIPPLYHAWARIGEQAVVPIVGAHAKRVLTGAISILSGTHLSMVTRTFGQAEFQDLLRRIRSRWRGWRIVLFLDRNSAHTSAASRQLAAELAIELRWLPTACPELNVMDTLWRNVKAETIANEPCPDVDESVQAVVDHLEQLRPYDRLQKAGAMSPTSWIASIRRAHY